MFIQMSSLDFSVWSKHLHLVDDSVLILPELSEPGDVVGHATLSSLDSLIIILLFPRLFHPGFCTSGFFSESFSFTYGLFVHLLIYLSIYFVFHFWGWFLTDLLLQLPGAVGGRSGQGPSRRTYHSFTYVLKGGVTWSSAPAVLPLPILFPLPLMAF